MDKNRGGLRIYCEMRPPPDETLSLLPALRRYALALTRHEANADDLVQEALLRGHERRRSFRAGGNFRAWLMSVLHNAWIDSRRSDLARAAREAAFAESRPQVQPPDQEDAMRLSQVRAAFYRLNDEQREALTLVAIEGLTYAEAAAVADVPVGTLISRVARGRAALRACEEGEGEAIVAPQLRIVGGRAGE